MSDISRACDTFTIRVESVPPDCAVCNRKLPNHRSRGVRFLTDEQIRAIRPTFDRSLPITKAEAAAVRVAAIAANNAKIDELFNVLEMVRASGQLIPEHFVEYEEKVEALVAKIREANEILRD